MDKTLPLTWILSSKIYCLQRNPETAYVEIKPLLSACAIYSKDSRVPEYARMAVTRLRLSSHCLHIETGRWTRTHVRKDCALVACSRLRNMCYSTVKRLVFYGGNIQLYLEQTAFPKCSVFRTNQGLMT